MGTVKGQKVNYNKIFVNIWCGLGRWIDYGVAP